jgi:hypothetical protein
VHLRTLKDIREQAARVIGDYEEKLEEEKNKGEKQKEKITELEAQIQRLRDDKHEMYDITQQVVTCRSPSLSYALFLHEQYLFFCLECIYQEMVYNIKDPIQFLRTLRSHDILTQHLMCELYMHNYLLRDDKKFNPVPYVGDVQLRAFLSYTINQVKWKKALDSFEENQVHIPLQVRMENFQVAQIINKHNYFRRIPNWPQNMETTQQWCAEICIK